MGLTSRLYGHRAASVSLLTIPEGDIGALNLRCEVFLNGCRRLGNQPCALLKRGQCSSKRGCLGLAIFLVERGLNLLVCHPVREFNETHAFNLNLGRHCVI